MWNVIHMDKIGIFTPTKLHESIEIDQIVTLHYFKYSKDFVFVGEKHDFWEIAYVDQGEIGIVADTQGIDLHQGEAVFHKPNEYHNIWAKNQFANVIILSFISKSPAMSFFENKIITLNNEARAIVSKILKFGEICFKDPLNDVNQTKLNLAENSPFGCEQVIKNYMELLLILLIQGNDDFSRQSRASISAKQQGESNIVDGIIRILSDNLYGSITLDDVLQQICFSKSYITMLFREQAGCSIMEYYQNMKITEAQRLISERKLSFTEIAELLGFSSIHYFSYQFKKKARMTPSEYRRTVHASAVL